MNAAMPASGLAVPELTGSAGIQLNGRVWFAASLARAISAAPEQVP
jgi:hypothetical protein